MLVPRLPLFPLGMVLLPGVRVPLHLFEPRYRQMLADVQQGDHRFGIICGIPGVPETELPAGRVGCVAEVTAAEMLPDGRSDIVVVGRDRFVLHHLVADDALYHVASVELQPDVPTGSPLALMLTADDVIANFRRVVTAVHILNNDPRDAPTVPDDPAHVAYTIASMIDVSLDDRQRLLSERSPEARLASIDAVLRRVLPDLELRAAMHRRSS